MHCRSRFVERLSINRTHKNSNYDASLYIITHHVCGYQYDLVWLLFFLCCFFFFFFFFIPDAITMDSARICVNAFHDGFQISWEELKFADNPVLSYHLQMAKGEQDYTYIYRGSASKYKYINHNLEDKIPYK